MSDFRMFDLNKVFLCGRLTRDPELRYLPDGTPVVNIGLAVSRQYKKANGQNSGDACFINVEAWRKQAEFVNKYFAKGRPMFVEGRLRSRSWETEGGQKRSVIEVRAERIQFMDWVDRGENRPAAPPQKPAGEDSPDEYMDDEVPF